MIVQYVVVVQVEYQYAIQILSCTIEIAIANNNKYYWVVQSMVFIIREHWKVCVLSVLNYRFE